MLTELKPNFKKIFKPKSVFKSNRSTRETHFIFKNKNDILYTLYLKLKFKIILLFKMNLGRNKM